MSAQGEPFDEADLQYWQEVLEGAREPDPASGMDIEDLALALIDDVRRERRERDEARAVAKKLMPHAFNRADRRAEALAEYPWLKE